MNDDNRHIVNIGYYINVLRVDSSDQKIESKEQPMHRVNILLTSTKAQC